MISLSKDIRGWLLWMLILPEMLIAQGPPEKPGNLPESCARIWQGFELQWSYPHPIIHFEDAVEFDDKPCSFSNLHSSETGVLCDSARLTQYFSDVEAPEVGFYPLEQAFLVEGRSGDTLRFDTVITLFHPDLSDPSTSCAVLINGFDIQTTEPKNGTLMQALLISVDSLRINPTNSSLSYRLNGHLVMESFGPGEKLFRNNLSFSLNISTLALIGGDFLQRSEPLFQASSWDRESQDSLGEQVAILPEAQDPMTKVTGIKRLSLALNEGFAIQNWSFYAQQRPSDEFNTRSIDLKIGVEPWTAGSKSKFKEKNLPSKRSGHRELVKNRPGTALGEMEIVVLKFRAGEAKPTKVIQGVRR